MLGVQNLPTDSFAFNRDGMTMTTVGIAQMFPPLGRRALLKHSAEAETSTPSNKFFRMPHVTTLPFYRHPIDLCLSVFPWARFRTTKGAIKLHMSVDHDGYLPTPVTVTEGKVTDLTEARTFALPQGGIVVFDRGHTDYGWYNKLDNQGISFVTRLKRNALTTAVERHPVNKKSGLTCDQTIHLTGTKATACPIALHRIGYKDPQTGKHYFFLTNNFHPAAVTQRNRWFRHCKPSCVFRESL